MKVSARLVLPADVQIIEYTGAERLDLPGEASPQYLVVRPGTRANAKLVSHDAAQLLQRFRAPATVIEAIIGESLARGLDPEQLLDEAFPVIQALEACGFLAQEDSILARPIKATYGVGNLIGHWTVLEVVHVLEDTEVYRVVDAQGNVAAVKLARNEEGTLLRHEAGVLAYLQGVGAPALLQLCPDARPPYIVMSWVNGETALQAAARWRSAEPGGWGALSQLCHSILDVYCELHSRGILHGDVHPRNMRVDDEGNVTLVDFGLADGAASTGVSVPGRGAFPQFADPEYAAAALNHTAPPPVTEASEQYALAASLYYLLSGHHYVDFSSDRETFLRQIVSEEPRPLTLRRMPCSTQVEAVLRQALSKQPAERFASLNAFRAAFTAAIGERGSAVVLPAQSGFLEEYGRDSRILAEGLASRPSVSVNFGAAGIAYAFYRLACIEESAAHLATADLWISRAKRDAVVPYAFTNEQLDITPQSVGPISLYHTAAGIHCVDALVQAAFGNERAAVHAARAFVTASSPNCVSLDLTLGISSTLIGCALLLEVLPGDPQIRELGATRLSQLWEALDACGPIAEEASIEWLGVAHGWAGALYATLRWCQVAEQPLPVCLAQRLDQLADCAKGSGAWRCWPRKPPVLGDREAAWKGWCHGSAGYVHLWTLAWAMLKDERWLELALSAGLHANDTEGSGPNLCCGLTGQAYAFLLLGQVTSDPEWLSRALRVTEKARQIASPSTMVRGSLYKGDIGLFLLEADLTRPSDAVMPLFG